MLDLIILAGGFGTRLKSLSGGLPKALMPIGTRNFLDITIKNILSFKIGKIFLSVHYKSELFSHFIDNSPYKKRIDVISEPKPLGTGGAIKHVIKKANISSPFFVINGDSVSKINLNIMLKYFLSEKLDSLLGISFMEDTSRFGRVKYKNGLVIAFKEKSKFGPGWINNGNYIFKKESFLKMKDVFSLEKDLFPRLLKHNKFGVFKVINDDFIDLGIPEDFKKFSNNYEKHIQNKR